MSQFFQAITAGSVPPSVPTSFVTDSGTAVPVANVLNVVTPGGGTQGIQTSAPGSSNTILVTLTDLTQRGTAQTVGATTANINVNTALATSNSVVNIRANITGYAKSSGIALGGELIGAVKNVGGVLTVLQVPELVKNNDVSLATWSATLVTSGTNVQIQVTGVATFTINWSALIDSITATEAQA